MKDSVSILIGGKAGQGIATIEVLLTKGFKRCGLYTFSTKEFMSRVRGGSNTTLIRIAKAPSNAPDYKVDIFVPLDEGAFFHARDRMHPETFLIAPKGAYNCDCILYDCDLESLAAEIGNPIVSNTIAAALVFGLLGCDGEILKKIVEESYAGQLLELNLKALRAGALLAQNNKECRYCLDHNSAMNVSSFFLSGTEGVGFGAIAGGVQFYQRLSDEPFYRGADLFGEAKPDIRDLRRAGRG